FDFVGNGTRRTTCSPASPDSTPAFCNEEILVDLQRYSQSQIDLIRFGKNAELIHDAKALWNKLPENLAAPNGRSIAINGSGWPTVEALVRIPGTFLDDWLVGGVKDADGTVPRLSSGGLTPDDCFIALDSAMDSAEHSKLPLNQTVRKAILSLLNAGTQNELRRCNEVPADSLRPIILSTLSPENEILFNRATSLSVLNTQ